MIEENVTKQDKIDVKCNKKLRFLSVLPVLIMMCIIFWFSAKPAHESEATSTPIAKAVMSVYEALHGTVDRVQHDHTLSTIDFLVRKTAHVTEYLILAICMAAALYTNQIRKKKFIIINLAATIGYAATDEFHQLFVEGRAGRIMDVGIDSIGCILGTLFFLLIVTLYQRKKSRKSA